MVVRTANFGLMVLLLAGCASLAGDPVDKPANASQPADQLSARHLNPGDCGLFVWTMPPDRRFILFSDNVSETAAWYDDQSEQALVLEDRSGEPAQGQFAIQTFLAPNGQVLDLDLTRGEDVVQGTRFPEGTLKISGDDGWRKIVPVSALAACQPAAS